jgi:hypothetical protein
MLPQMEHPVKWCCQMPKDMVVSGKLKKERQHETTIDYPDTYFIYKRFQSDFRRQSCNSGM